LFSGFIAFFLLPTPDQESDKSGPPILKRSCDLFHVPSSSFGVVKARFLARKAKDWPPGARSNFPFYVLPFFPRHEVFFDPPSFVFINQLWATAWSRFLFEPGCK